MAARTEAYLETRGITATPAELEQYLAEALDSLESVVLTPASTQLAPSELQVLRRGGFDLESSGMKADDPLAQSIADYAALLKTALTTRKAAKLLGRDESRIRQRLLKRTLYGIHKGSSWMLPLFQFEVAGRKGKREPKRLIPGIEAVFPKLDPELNPVTVYRWFVSPSDELYDEQTSRPLSPRDWLLAGHSPDRVVALAADL
jgi:hypothetical protein